MLSAHLYKHSQGGLICIIYETKSLFLYVNFLKRFEDEGENEQSTPTQFQRGKISLFLTAFSFPKIVLHPDF